MERGSSDSHRRLRPNSLALAGAAGLLMVSALAWMSGEQAANRPETPGNYRLHSGITATVFWVGEGADTTNRFIHNRSSTWIEDWVGAYGGIDDPKVRCGFLPCGFIPKENPFYFALPYNDLDENCDAKPSQRQAPWFTETPPEGESIIKNRWIEIRYQNKTAYAQWEDAGPFGEDDTGYVFSTDGPRANAGLDLSPAVAGYLGLDGEGQTDWRFIQESAVPAGPWRQTITGSAPDCAK